MPAFSSGELITAVARFFAVILTNKLLVQPAGEKLSLIFLGATSSLVYCDIFALPLRPVAAAQEHYDITDRGQSQAAWHCCIAAVLQCLYSKQRSARSPKHRGRLHQQAR
jgi:hypothetical protein